MNYVITGRVIKGDGYGRKLGFPTVNLKTTQVTPVCLPADGVYAGVGELEGREYRAGIVIGPDGKIEAHLIGFDGDAYGKMVTLKTNKFLRAYQKFDTEDKLIIQIKKDIDQC